MIKRCPCEYCTKKIETCRDFCDVYWDWFDSMVLEHEVQHQKRKDHDQGDE